MANNAIFVGQSTFGQIIGEVISGLAAATIGARFIAKLQPHITTQEIHRDELQITIHPVETGTPITDHAFPMPYTVEMHVAWSDSTAQTSGFAQAVYQALLSVQASRQRITVVSGKRLYSSMLIKSLMVMTDPETEYVLSVVALLQQIVVTNTQSASAVGQTSNTNGSSQVGSISPNNITGEPATPGLDFGNGVGTIPDGAISAGNTFTWPNDPIGGGSTELIPADAGAPTVESLTQNQGV